MYGRSLGFLASLCLHLAVFILILFWPATSPPELPLSGRMVTGIVSFAPAEVKTQEVPAETSSQPAEPEVEPDVPPNLEVPRHQPPETPDQPDTPPAETPVETPPPPEDPVIPETPIPVEPERPVRNATSQAPETPREVRPPARNATPRTPTRTPPRRSTQSPENALAELMEGLGPDTAAGAENRPGSPGISGTYLEGLVSRIKPNWTWPGTTDRRSYVAVVNIKIARDGTILGWTLKSSSGNAVFDGSVTSAIQKTGVLEPPPTPELMDIDVTFTPDKLGGR